MKNVTETIKDILTECPLILQFTNNVSVDFTVDSNDTNFGLSSAGDIKVSESITGVQKRRHSFIIYGVQCSITDFQRVANSNFINDLGFYLESLKNIEVQQVIGNETKTGLITKITSGGGMKFEFEENTQNGMYQLQINVDYKLNP